MGGDFFGNYRNLLSDCGKMSAEELASKHLSVDLEKHDFWISSIEIVEKMVTEMESIS